MGRLLHWCVNPFASLFQIVFVSAVQAMPCVVLGCLWHLVLAHCNSYAPQQMLYPSLLYYLLFFELLFHRQAKRGYINCMLKTRNTTLTNFGLTKIVGLCGVLGGSGITGHPLSME